MKNQYFGDNKDLFKFDLAERILKKKLVADFYYVPMLTASDDNTHGNDRSKAQAGFKNKALLKFLDARITDNKRDVRQLEKYFDGIKIKTVTFTHAGRTKYFADVVKGLPANSLIFIDPDTGVQKTRPTAKHVLWDELKAVYEKMDSKSILIVNQNIPRGNLDTFLHDTCHDFLDYAGKDPLCTFNSETVLFLIAKTQKLEQKLITLAGEYSELYS
jgi:hypothetical protein